MIRLVIADDHPVVRAGLQGLLRSQSDFMVVGEAANGKEALELVMMLEPDVVLMDLRMPELDGVGAIAAIKARTPKTNVLVLTTYDSDGDIVRAVEAGATGYLLKDTPKDDLFRAVRATARGEAVLTLTVASRLMGKLRAPAEEGLSAREREVLALVAKGLSNKQVAKHLHISEATVKTHLLHIFSKLGVSDRTAAVMRALERGLIEGGP